MPHWTIDDYAANLCEFSQVGMSKAPPEPPPIDVPDLPPELSSIPAAILKRDAMIAYQKLGGPQFLMDNEQLLAKVLLKLLPAEIQQSHGGSITVNIRFSNPNFNKPPEPVDVVENELPLVPSLPLAVHPTPAEAAKSWKEPAPDAEVAVGVRSVVAAYSNTQPKPSAPERIPNQANLSKLKRGDVDTD